MGAHDQEHRPGWLCGVNCCTRLPVGTHCCVGRRSCWFCPAGGRYWALPHCAFVPADVARADRTGFRTTFAVVLAGSPAWPGVLRRFPVELLWSKRAVEKSSVPFFVGRYFGFFSEFINAMMRTLFLQAPSFDGYDGGAGARYQMRREVRSFWYPTWLAQPAALVEGSKLIDAPPHGLTFEDVAPEALKRDLLVLHTSTPSFASDVKTVEALKALKPRLKIGMIGAKVAVEPELSLKASAAIDFVTRNE